MIIAICKGLLHQLDPWIFLLLVFTRFMILIHLLWSFKVTQLIFKVIVG